MNTKYKVGDKVVIKQDLDERYLYTDVGVVSDMLIYRGKEATISEVNKSSYSKTECTYKLDIDGGHFYWNDFMFEDEQSNQIKEDELYFAKVKEDAIIPSKTDENGGYDVYACFEEEYIIIQPHETKLIPTGIATAFSSDYVAILKERGSTGTKGIGQRCGVIDAGYRGEWFVPLTNHNSKPLLIAKNNKDTLVDDYIIYPYEKAIAQFIMVEVPKLETKEVAYEELQNFKSERMNGALGSSGK
jgi:dUTP pyrophosphatase